MQLVSKAVIEKVDKNDALINTKPAYLIISSSLHAQLKIWPTIQPYKNEAPDIIGVGGASTEIKKIIEVPLRLAGTEVAHIILVV